jgi:NADH-quinone oxidoreductase subunit G
VSEAPPPIEITEGVSIEIDGKEIEVQKGELLIDACERNGTYIPRFCYHPRMEPVGMCRMCLVEVDTGRGPALQPSCMIECTPDMKVDTGSEKVRKAQDGVLEFLLINHPLDCPVCDKGGECPLQDQTIAYGPGESRWTEEKRHYPKPIPISETVYLDRERCILCDRCTRFAKDVAGDPLIHFMDRGSSTQVNTFPDEPFASYFSGNTVQICPVGALTAKPYRFKARPWDLTQVESTCTGCSVGCRISVESSRNQVLRYQGVDSDPVNWGWLCDKGRFGFEAVNSAERLGDPLVRRGADLAAVRWSEALDAASVAIRAGLDSGNGPGGVAVLGGARLTNESAYQWTKLAKGVIGTDHVDAQLGDGLPADLVLGLPAATIDDVCRPGGTVIYLGPDPKEELPVLYLRLRHAAVNDGVKIVELAPIATGLSPYVAASVRYRPGESAATLATILESGSSDDPAIAKAASLVGAAEGDITVVIGRPSVTEGASTIVDSAALLRRTMPRARFLVGLRRANVRGALDMGMAPGILPGRIARAAGSSRFAERWPTVPTDDGLDAAGILRAAADGKIDTLVMLGADPLADFPDRALAERALTGARFVIAVDQFLTESSRQADVVLPAAGFAEVDGTTTSIEGRITTVAQKVTAAGSSRPDWLIAGELAARLGHDFGTTAPAQIWSEIESIAPSHAGVTEAVLTSTEFADGVVAPMDGTEVALLEFEPGPSGEVPVVDSYSWRLVARRTLYDQGTLLQHSPASAALATDAAAHLNQGDLDQLGVDDGGRVRVIGNDHSFVIGVVADASIPRGIVAIALGQANAPIRTVIDSSSAVTDVRLEVDA